MIVPRIIAGDCGQSGTLKKYLRETRGDHCQECGCGPSHNGKPLSFHLDHIDGNSDNNLVENLRMLCPNCHSQTETYSGKDSKKPKDTKRNRYLRKFKGYDEPEMTQ